MKVLETNYETQKLKYESIYYVGQLHVFPGTFLNFKYINLSHIAVEKQASIIETTMILLNKTFSYGCFGSICAKKTLPVF